MKTDKKNSKSKIHFFWKHTDALSVMHDAILFLVLISLSAVILFPAFNQYTTSEKIIEQINEKRVDDFANVFLSTTVRHCNYTIASDLIDPVANSIGINTSEEEGLYHTITDSVLGHEIQHEPFAQLIAENLASQCSCSFLNGSSDQMNVIINEFTRFLDGSIRSFMQEYLPDHYQFQLIAHWMPIKGVDFGGKIVVGNPPPQKDYFVSEQTICMPYAPVISWGNVSFVFSEYWIDSLLDQWSSLGQSEIYNISIMLTDYIEKNQTNQSEQLRRQFLTENITTFFLDFTVDGIQGSNESLIFPGILSLVIDSLFSSVITFGYDLTETVVHQNLGNGFARIERFIADLNVTDLIHPISDIILNQINGMISEALNQSFTSIEHAIQQLKKQVKTAISDQLMSYIYPLAQTYANLLLDQATCSSDVFSMFSSWITNQFSLSQATVTLIIWGKS